MSLHCPICQGPIEKFHRFENAPTAEEIVAAWVELGKPTSMDLSNDLFLHQAGIVWPNPDNLEADDPKRQILGMSIRAHEGAGFWMRPAAITYARLQCMDCHEFMSRAIPADAVPVGAVLRCAKCEIKNQEARA
jgi:hypothetical protein